MHLKVAGPAGWLPLKTAILENAHELVQDLADITVTNVEQCARAFYSFLIKVKGHGLKEGCDPSHLLSPGKLNAFWRFYATIKNPMGGRGYSRDSMRQLCNSVIHLVAASWAAGYKSKEHNGLHAGYVDAPWRALQCTK